MKLGRFFVSLVTFLFTVFLFPSLNNAIANASITSDVAPLIAVFPYVFIVVSAFFTIYFGVEEVNS